jgi:membrane protease YdiL (CAAX protease family)
VEDKLAIPASTRTRFSTGLSVAAFFILGTGLGASVVYLVVKGILPSAATLPAALSAAIAGIIMTAVEDGRAGLKLMLRRLLIWRVGFGYWLYAFLFIIPVILIGSLANPLFNGDRLSFSNIEPAFQIVPMFFAFFIIAGVGEELGWSGFLMPRLQARYSAFTSSLIRAILMGLWTLPLFIFSWLNPALLANLPYAAWIAQSGFLPAFGVFMLLLVPPWSVFYTWIFNNTGGSLLLVAVLHASEIWVAYWMLSTGIDPNNLDNYFGYGILMVIVATIIVITSGPQNLSRKGTRIVRQLSLRQELTGN